MVGGAGRARRRVSNERDFVGEGLRASFFGDLYHLSMTVSWPVFFAGTAATFLGLNAIYACLYLLGVDPIANVRPGHAIDLLYFSIETLATVGYGDMHPQTDYGHVIATIEIFTGMSMMAVMTGLVFARFARPRAMIVFADVLVVSRHDGRQTLMLRVANARQNLLSNASAKLWLSRNEKTAEGESMRRFHRLKLERDENPLFQLSWTLFHVMDETSLLFGLQPVDFERASLRLIVTISGLDETSSDEVHARHSYAAAQVRFGHRYADILRPAEGGATRVDFSKFHETVEIGTG